MTGFAAVTGDLAAQSGTHAMQMDLRAVNGRGLDLRLRLPEGLEGFEAEARRLLSGRLARGSVTLSLRLMRPDAAAGDRLNPVALDAALDLLAAVDARAEARGLTLAPHSAADVLGLRGVLDTAPQHQAPVDLIPALIAALDRLIDDFDASRLAEGAALSALLASRLSEVEGLLQAARALHDTRREGQADALRAALARLSETVPQADPGRLEQELALLAVKTDIAEELDRLTAHVAAARALLADPAPTGRKLDFLMQEFNREANTLCAKSQNAALTRIGLDLKSVIDQMREQVQNVE